MKLLRKTIATAILATLGTVAMAGTATGSFQSTATVGSKCVLSVDNASLGVITVDQMSGDVQYPSTTINLSILCSKSVVTSISQNGGLNPTNAGKVVWLSMKGTGANQDILNYTMTFGGPNNTNSYWGNSSNGSPIPHTGTGVLTTIPIKVGFQGAGTLSNPWPNQPLIATPDSYSDTVTVNATY